MKKKKVVIGFSGGMDSTTLLAYMLNMDYDVHCCFFDYGSKHSKHEHDSVHKILHYYWEQHRSVKGSITSRHFNLIEIFKGFESNLLKDGGAIPEGHYEHESMKATKVPGRNMIMSSIMAGVAENIGASSIALGVHAGDHAIYPDCRPEFTKAVSLAIYLSSDTKVTVETPFESFRKKDILELGYSFNLVVPYNLTRTCYKDQKISCGKCGSCQERIEAYQQIGMVDPIQYETLEDYL